FKMILSFDSHWHPFFIGWADMLLSLTLNRFCPMDFSMPTRIHSTNLCSISSNIREGLLETFYGIYEKDPDRVTQVKEREMATTELGFKKPLTKEERLEKKKQRLAAIGETYDVSICRVADYICIFITSYAMELLRFREAGIEVIVKASFLLPDVLRKVISNFGCEHWNLKEHFKESLLSKEQLDT
ncbi:hypothetical protein B296_00053656, partial [Ensete ventricosum]